MRNVTQLLAVCICAYKQLRPDLQQVRNVIQLLAAYMCKQICLMPDLQKEVLPQGAAVTTSYHIYTIYYIYYIYHGIHKHINPLP